ncbi:MAG: two-component regulator propeller domain-containing protein, partial [Gammaproteobacteria bacterium]
MFRRGLLTLAAALAIAAAPAEARRFTQIGAGTDLEARVIPALLFDASGFLWVGSREGLYRYDGYEARDFPTGVDGPSDNDVRCLFEGSDGTLWIGTNSGGLNRYDPASQAFATFRSDPADPTAIPDDSIYRVTEDSDGVLWVGTQRGLARMDPETGTFRTYRHDPADPASLSHNWAFALHVSADGALWAGTVGGGLNRFDAETGRFDRFDLAELTGGPASRNDVFVIEETKDGELWLGTRAGLVALDPATGTARPVPLEAEGNDSAVITAMTRDDDGRFWLATMLRGVLIVDPSSGTWTPAVELEPGAPGNVPAELLMSLALQHDHVYVGTWGSGLYRAPLADAPFSLLAQERAGAELLNEIVSAVLATAEAGRPWLGRFCGGPQRVDGDTGAVLSQPSVDGALRRLGVLDLARDESGKLYAAGTLGLFEFDAEGGERQLELRGREPEDSPGAGYVHAVLPGADGGLWVGVMGGGVFRRDGATGPFLRHGHDPARPSSLGGDFVTALAQAPRGRLWVGTRSNGLNLCRTDQWACQRFPGRGGERDLAHHHVTDIYRDRRDRYWVATDGGGIHRVLFGDDGEVTGFEHWGTADGLVDDGVMAIQEDLDESLWLSTRVGLSRINPT